MSVVAMCGQSSGGGLSLLLASTLVLAQLSHGDICEQSVCQFHMVVKRTKTMTYIDPQTNKGYNVILNGTQLQVTGNTLRLDNIDPLVGTVVQPDDVISADGFLRSVITINDQFPGPTLEVMEGAQVIVHVHNQLLMEVLCVHWHGMYQRGTPWMDGVSMVTQCPVLPQQSFTYRFRAEPAGSHWYHSHHENQRLDGLYGALIVHKHLPFVPSVPVLLTDWFHEDAATHLLLSPFPQEHMGTGELHLHHSLREFSADSVQIGEMRSYTGLINGRGRSNNKPFPLTVFQVKQNRVHRMRFINAASEYAFKVSIDEHELGIVALDGYSIKPIKVDSFIIFPGERIDAVFKTDKTGRYWLRSSTLRDGIGQHPQHDHKAFEFKAIVAYDGSSRATDPTSSRKDCTSGDPCMVFNCPFGGYATWHHMQCVHVSDTYSIEPLFHLQQEYGIEDEHPEEYFFNFGFNFGASVNARQFVRSSAPLLQDHEGYTVECDEELCTSEGCRCTYTPQLPFNKTVQLVLTNLQPGADVMAHHPIHFHGHNFAVMKMGFPDYDRATGFWTEVNQDVQCANSLCTQPRWSGQPPDLKTAHPPLKDTIVVPARGYVVIRFRTTNPGWWFVHCHVDQHVLQGMGMVLHEAPSHVPSLPPGFPTCGNYTPTGL